MGTTKIGACGGEMNVKQFAAQMKAQIEEIKSNGTTTLNCDNIIAYLSDVENSSEAEPSVLDIERYKADLQNFVEANKYQHEERLEIFRSTIVAGQAAIKSSFLLNGGAAVALLAFITHLAQFKTDKVPEFAACLLLFAFGILAITVTSGFTYLSQWFSAHTEPWASKIGYGVNLFCIFLGFGSYALFLWGLFSTYGAFNTFH
jgi:hypothetical protein